MSGSRIAWPIQRFSAGRPRSRATRSWCNSSLKNERLLASTISRGMLLRTAVHSAVTPIRKSPSPSTATGSRSPSRRAKAAPTAMPGPDPMPPPPSAPRKSSGCRKSHRCSPQLSGNRIIDTGAPASASFSAVANNGTSMIEAVSSADSGGGPRRSRAGGNGGELGRNRLTSANRAGTAASGSANRYTSAGGRP